MIEKILQTIALAGADLPAYKALFDMIISTMASGDQDMLKRSYEDAMAEADLAHRAAQAD